MSVTVAPPTGTVTLLFTDIEGSTKRWEHRPVEMAAALQQHDRHLQSAIGRNGGYVFKTIGDAFCAAFSSPVDALQAAFESQRALAADQWGEVGPVRVRMALHTGEPEHRELDYFGPPVNRVARILSTGYGEQVLVSAATAALVQDQLPGGSSLVDLGAHHLKDLLQPERIYQFSIAGLQDEFPPLKSLDRASHNLPSQPTAMVGREREVARATGLIRDGSRLVTLSGPGGTGKTRIALQAAADLVDAFPDGAWFVDLAPVADAALVVSAIARPLGVREAGHEPLEQSLRDYARDKRMLLVFDNFEHVLAAAPVVGRLLAECPGVQALATSRAVLRVYGETELPIPALGLPDPKRLPSLEELGKIEAVELFVERAAAVKPGFTLTAANAQAVAAICVRLEGLPLAIELAATRVRVLAPDQLLDRLANRLDLLTGGASDRDGRQRTLRGAIAWSFDLLSEDEQSLFRQLGVFAGATFEAIEAVAGGSIDVLDGIESLVQKSLVRQEELEHEPRFRMLETIREFALERLDERDNAAQIRAAHAGYYLALAEEIEPALTGPEQLTGHNRLDAEHDNIRAALRWYDAAGAAAEGLALAAAMWRFWDVRGHLTEGRRWLEPAIARASPADSSVLARASTGAAWLAWGQGDHDQANAHHEMAEFLYSLGADQAGVGRARYGQAEVARAQANYARAAELHRQGLEIAREAGDRRGGVHSLIALGTLAATVDGDLNAAAAFYSQAIPIYREIGDTKGLAAGLINLAAVEFFRGDYALAAARYTEVLALSRSLGDAQTVAIALANLAEIRFYEGRWSDAIEIGSEAIADFGDLGDRHNRALALLTVGRAALSAGELSRGRESLRESLVTVHALGDLTTVAPCLEGLAVCMLDDGDAELGALVFAGAAAVRETAAVIVHETDLPEYEARLAQFRAALGEPAFTSTWEMGWSMSTAQAVSEALAATVPQRT